MRRHTTLNILVLALTVFTTPVLAQTSGGQSGGALGGVLDTLGGLLGGGSRKLHGTVVVSDGNTLVLRADDRRTYRVDVASLDPSVRTRLAPGQAVTVSARGGQGEVLTATEIQPDAHTASATTFQRVTGTIQESGRQRVLFKTGDGLVLPVDVSRVHGLPYLAADQPATLYYEQGPKQEIVAVWIESGAAREPAAATGPPTASPSPAASVAASLRGTVQTIGIGTLTLQTSDGKTVSVDTSTVDPQSVASVRPGDVVTVTGTETSEGGRFTAHSIQRAR
jgi:hypothetical protein